MTTVYGGTQKAASSWLIAVLRTSRGLKVAHPKEWNYWSEVLGYAAHERVRVTELQRPLTMAELIARARALSPLSGVRLDSVAPRMAFSPSSRRVRTSVARMLRPRPTSALEHWARLVSPYDIADFSPSNVVLGASQWEELRTAVPDLKVIVGIRNPTQRTWSALRMSVRKGILEGGFASAEVLEYLTLPGREQLTFVSRTVRNLKQAGVDVLVISVDEVANDATLLRRLGEFVGASLSPLPPRHVGPSRPMPPALRELLDDRLREELDLLEGTAGHSLVL